MRVSDQQRNNQDTHMTLPKALAADVTITLALTSAGCSALVAVGDAAITVGATAVKITAKAVGAVADAVIPDGDKKKVDN